MGYASDVRPSPLAELNYGAAQGRRQQDGRSPTLQREFGEHGFVGVIGADFCDAGRSMAWAGSSGYAELEPATR